MKSRTTYITDDGAEFTDYESAAAHEREINPPVKRPRLAHILTVLIIDHDELGAGDVVATLTNAHFPNDCINPMCLDVRTYNIGVWHNDHPLNLCETDEMSWIREHGIDVTPAEVTP